MITLKHELRAKGLYYRDIAARLRVSEGTVKRYFTGKGVSLTVLRKLAEIADLDLLSLAERAEREGAGRKKFTKAQQTALGKNRFISAVFFLLWHGWSPEKIGREFQIAGELGAALEKLESLGLVRRLAHEVKILATPDIEQRGGGQLSDLTRDHAQMFLSEIDLRDAKTDWICTSARLSRASAARLHDTINKFMEDMRAATIADSDLPPEQVQWYRMFVGAQPISRKRFLQVR